MKIRLAAVGLFRADGRTDGHGHGHGQMGQG